MTKKETVKKILFGIGFVCGGEVILLLAMYYSIILKPLTLACYEEACEWYAEKKVSKK